MYMATNQLKPFFLKRDFKLDSVIIITQALWCPVGDCFVFLILFIQKPKRKIVARFNLSYLPMKMNMNISAVFMWVILTNL